MTTFRPTPRPSARRRALILFSILAVLNWFMLTLFGAWHAWRGERAFRYPFALPVAGLLAHRAEG